MARRGVAVAGQGSERTLAAVAHGAIAFGFLGVGFLLSVAITVVIWLVSWKSDYVREQADRAGRYQIFVLLLNVVVVIIWALGLGLLVWLTGWRIFDGGAPDLIQSGPVTVVLLIDTFLLITAIPIFLVWYVGTILYGVYGAARALAGHDFRYPALWGRRKRRERAAREVAAEVEEDCGDGEGGEGEPEVVDEVLKRKLQWED